MPATSQPQAPPHTPPVLTPAHTPGPWWADADAEGDDCVGVNCIDRDGDEATVCLVQANGRVGSEDVATARLIAAAPDLLAACRSLLPAVAPGPHGPATGQITLDQIAALQAAVARAAS